MIRLRSSNSLLKALGNIYFDLNQYDQAISYYQQLIELKPSWPDPYATWADVLRLKGQPEPALEKTNKAFGAGADITEFPQVRSDAAQGRAYGELIHSTMQAIGECIHPTIAMIHGACVGGGLEVALMCDLRICGESSCFGIPINRLGLTMGYGELSGLLSVVGPAVALEILLEGRIFGAEEAREKGLVQRVVADEFVETEARATAERIAAGAPLVARWHKRFIRRLSPPLQLSADEWCEGFACFDTADYREGLRAFLNKQVPRFSGR